MSENDLKLPIIKDIKTKKNALSMDKYLEFVNFHRKYTFNKEAYEKWKKISAVKKRFTL